MLTSAMCGLFGCVTPNLRRVTVDFNEQYISLYFYYDESPSELEEELAEVAASEILACFPDIEDFQTYKIHLSYPQKPDPIGHTVYVRYEPTPPEFLEGDQDKEDR